MDVVRNVIPMQALADRLRAERRIVFVPTMGFLHEGHLSLIRIARNAGDVVVVSIFVNPTQFGPGEDFQEYPRALDRDLALAEKEGADIVFTPSEAELYPEGFETYVHLERLPRHLCGLSRPVFFRGVATVVTKLFHIVKPHAAVFGEKDYQQVMVVKKMVRDLNMDVEIIAGPTVREPDGLAMSSRNSYLSKEQRRSALSLRKALIEAQQMVSSGERSSARIVSAAKDAIASFPETDIDYIRIFDPETLEDRKEINGPVRMALAVRVGSTRLIDNDLLNPAR
ncbi:MAG: pantoate--beta-alanine ligase [Desulfobacterales bacterium]|nr:pantoate--beta-alanine ligase [Desulfobacterales bacterium]